MKYRILILISVVVFSFAFTSTETTNEKEKITTVTEPVPAKAITFKEEVANTYNAFSKKSLNLPTLEVFEKGMKGYYKLEKEGQVARKILTIVDFNLSSSKKRMWILDMEKKEVLFHTYTSHGKNTGGEFAKMFSNTLNSLQSSLGFYITGETYYGSNGLSLFIDGKEKGYNSNARKRYVVIHGADYATPAFIKRHGRLGRSYGCPAVPNSLAKDLINTIKGESVVYIHKNSSDYLKNSSYLNYPTA